MTKRIKCSEGYGVKRIKAEYDDIARISEERGISVQEMRRLIERKLGNDEQ